jgi:hypothetical protein
MGRLSVLQESPRAVRARDRRLLDRAVREPADLSSHLLRRLSQPAEKAAELRGIHRREQKSEIGASRARISLDLEARQNPGEFDVAVARPQQAGLRRSSAAMWRR